MRLLSTRSLAILGLLGAALAVSPAPRRSGLEPPAWRPVAGRLSGLGYAPWAPAVAAAAAPPPTLVRSRLHTAAARQGVPEDPLASARGASLRALLADGLDAAIGELERALPLLAGDRQTAALTTDLAALYLQRSHQPAHAFDAVLALDLLASLPERSPAATFNLALALERFGLRAAAARAWREAAGLDPGSGWAREAAARSSRLQAPVLEATWEPWRRRLLDGAVPSGEELALWSRRVPGVVFDTALYELLGRWGRECAAAVAESPSCGALLGMTLVIAEQLPPPLGRALREAAEDLRVAAPDRRQRLARGHAALEEGWRASERLEIAAARRALERAVAALRGAGSPLVGWAEYWLAATHLHQGRYEPLRRELGGLARRAADPRLRASIARTLGTAAARQQSMPTAERLWGEAIAGFHRAGDRVSAAIVRCYLSEIFFLQGRTDEGWARALHGLEEMAQWPTGEYWPYLVNNAAGALIRQGRPAAAAVLAEESARGLERADADAVEVAEAWLQLGHAAAASGRAGSARLALAPAGRAVAEIPDPHLRERMTADLAMATGLATREPAESLAALSQAIEVYERKGLRVPLPAAYEARARRRLELGQAGPARSDLELGIAEHERALAQFPDALAAVPFAEVGQRLYDRSAALTLDLAGDPWAAFSLADRAKDSALLHRLRREPSGALSEDRVRAALAEDEALVAFTLLEDRLLCTLVTRRQVVHRVSPDPSRQVAARAARLLALLAGHGDPLAARREGAWLYQQLLDPFADLLAGTERLILVPDRGLNLVPFAALVDPRGDRFLIERHAFTLVPSVGHLLALRAPRNLPAAAGDWRVGLVATGEPAPGGALAALPAAETEVRAIAELYVGSRILTGNAGTLAGLLGLLPEIDVLHFAGHARGEPEAPWRARLWLAKGGREGGLEPVPASRLAGAPLDHLALVVLSGCETALPSRRRSLGSDGLSAAFLARGARAVVATLWRVEDAVVARLMIALHRGLAEGHEVAGALRLAQLEVSRSGSARERHPGSWAFAQLSGLPVRRPPTEKEEH